MAWTEIGTGFIQSLGAGGGTSNNLDTTGMDFIAIAFGYYSGSHTIIASDITDSAGNTLIQADTITTDNGEGATVLFYLQNPTTSTTHHWTIGVSSIFAAIAVRGWSGSTTSPLDQVNQAGSTGTVSGINTGSITTSENNELIVSSCGADANTLLCSISDLNALQIGVVGGQSYALGLSAGVKATAGSINPSWSPDGSRRMSALVASFKGASAPPSGRIWVLAGQGGGLAGPSCGLAGTSASPRRPSGLWVPQHAGKVSPVHVSR